MNFKTAAKFCIFLFALSVYPSAVRAQTSTFNSGAASSSSASRQTPSTSATAPAIAFFSSLEGFWRGSLSRQDSQGGRELPSVDMRTILTVTRIGLHHWTYTMETTSSLGTIETRTADFRLQADGHIVIHDGLCLTNAEVVDFQGFYTLDYAGFGSEIYPQQRQVDLYQKLSLSRDGALSGSSRTLINGNLSRQDRFQLRRI